MRKYSSYKTSKGYANAVVNALEGTIVERYRATEKALAKELGAIRQVEASVKDIKKEFKKQMKLVEKRLQKERKIKQKSSKKRYGKRDVDKIISAALRSGKFADPAELFGQNVIETLKGAGVWKEFRLQVRAANYAKTGNSKFIAIDPKKFKAVKTTVKNAQTVRYDNLVEFTIIWSPEGFVSLTNLWTGRTIESEEWLKEVE